MTRIVATSDLHGTLPDIPECDILLLAGDVCPVWNHERKFQANWMRGDFTDWLNKVPAKHIVGIGGNHDHVLSGHKQKFGYTLPWNYLNNEAVTIEGLKIWGSPLSTTFGNWSNMKPEPALSDIWNTIPRDIDILMTHGPAYGFGDKTGMVWEKELMPAHIGSTSLRYQLDSDTWPNLKYFIFGHCHEGYGSYRDMYYNVSHMDQQMNSINSPVVIDV